MYDIFYNIIGMDLGAFHVDHNIQYVVIFLVVLFVIGEIFNIIRLIFSHIFGG